MFLLNRTPGSTAQIAQQELLFFSGYSYLGMHQIPAFISLLQQGLKQYGILFPSSRISNTQLDLYSTAEEHLSKKTNTAATVLFASGFAAGQAASTLHWPGSKQYKSPHCHPAIGGNHAFENLDFLQWASATVEDINQQPTDKPAIILSDVVNPITAELYDFTFLSGIKKKSVCILDDSHGIGVIGNHGEGISSRLPNNAMVEYILTYSLSKAMNLQAGAVSCTNATTAAALRQSVFYSTSTPPSPAMIYALLHADTIYDQQHKRLLYNHGYLRNLLRHKSSIQSHPELPIFVFSEQMDEQYFEQAGIIISSFSYPDPQGSKINRAVVNALHTESDLQKLSVAVLNFPA